MIGVAEVSAEEGDKVIGVRGMGAIIERIVQKGRCERRNARIKPKTPCKPGVT
jgi:hypothetical protein